MFKSSKLIPTMIVNVFFFDKTYSVLDYCCALFLCLGTAMFIYDPSASSASSSISTPGVGMLIGAVACDAFLPNVQKKMMNTVIPEELMVNSNLFGFIVLLLAMLFSGAINDLARVIFTAEKSYLLCASLAGVGSCLTVAVYCYTHLIKEAGPVLAVSVATLRKVITLFLSYVVFPKPLSPMETVALLLIIVGITLETWKRSLSPSK